MFSCTFPAVTGKALSGRLIKSLVTTLCFQSFQMLRFPSLRQVAFSEVRVIGYYWVTGLGLLQEELQSIASLSALVQTGSSVCVLQEALQVPPASPIPGRIFPLFFFFPSPFCFPESRRLFGSSFALGSMFRQQALFCSRSLTQLGVAVPCP